MNFSKNFFYTFILLSSFEFVTWTLLTHFSTLPKHHWLSCLTNKTVVDKKCQTKREQSLKCLCDFPVFKSALNFARDIPRLLWIVMTTRSSYFLSVHHSLSILLQLTLTFPLMLVVCEIKTTVADLEYCTLLFLLIPVCARDSLCQTCMFSSWLHCPCPSFLRWSSTKWSTQTGITMVKLKETLPKDSVRMSKLVQRLLSRRSVSHKNTTVYDSIDHTTQMTVQSFQEYR
jgi:hypothetical protein